MTSRRAFLRGAGAALALPLLPSLLPREARAGSPRPVRLLFFYVPNGVNQVAWRPTGEGRAWTPGPTLATLEDVRDHVLVISGLRNRAAEDPRPGDHARGTAAFLTCVPASRDGVALGPSVDQVAAQAVGRATPFRSLELGVEAGGSLGTCDAGYSCAYMQNVSWAGPSTPMPKMTRPRLVFERLFGGGGGVTSPAEASRRALYRSSVLDVVREQAAGLQRRLSSTDRQRLDEYLTGVREIERRIEDLGACTAVPPVPADVAYQEHADVLLDLAVAAIQCDLTRVVSFMLANSASNAVYRFLPGVSGAHHELSHHQGQAGHLAQLAAIDAWEVGRFARLVRRLADTPDGEDGSLLDHALVFFGSEIADGDRHDHVDLPVLIAGRGGGAVTPGRHLVARDEPVADVFLAMLHAAGVSASTFGVDGTRPLPGLRR